jgi:hypothetical protein
MAKWTKGPVTYNDESMYALLHALGADSKETRLFVKGAMNKATGEVVGIMKAAAVAAGYPTAPGIRYTKTRGQRYKVWGRVPGSIRRGKFVAKRRDNGDTSQRIIVSSKLRGTSVGAPHANITRYSKNTQRKTKDGQNRGKFAAMPFVAATTVLARGATLRGFRAEYRKYVRLVSRIR